MEYSHSLSLHTFCQLTSDDDVVKVVCIMMTATHICTEGSDSAHLQDPGGLDVSSANVGPGFEEAVVAHHSVQ